MPTALQTMLWIRRAQWMLRQCAARFGDTFSMQIANQGPWMVISHPRDIETVFKGDPAVLHAGEGNGVLEPVLGSHSVLLLDGAAHLSHRKLMLPAFHGRRMAAYTELIAQIAGREIDSWPRGEVQRLRPRMQAVTLEVILQAVLGVTDERRREQLRAALRTLLEMLTDARWTSMFLMLGPHRLNAFPPFRKRLAAVDRLVYAEIAERRRADVSSRQDIMSLLVAAQYQVGDRIPQASHNDLEDGSPMSDQDLRDELITLLVAGHETTANALAWAGERLARHPDKLARLADDARSGDDAYTRAVVQETLRLRPVISIVQRVLKAPMTIAGYDLPAGHTVVPALYLVNRRADLYPDPDRFEPERFLGQGAPGTYTWIPFGGGVRRCLGAAFAQSEMETVLRELALRAVIRPVRPGSEPTLRRAVTETPRHDAEVLVS